MRATLCSAFLAATVGASPAAAHHSGAAFDDNAEITIEGVVTKFEWANPHAYIYVTGVDDSGARVEWAVEAPPTAFLRRAGWSADTLSAGERVTVHARPARNRARTDALFMSVTKADGSTLDRQGIGVAISESDSKSSVKADGVSGTWATLIGESTTRLYEDTDSLKDDAIWPLTPKAAAAVASFNEEIDHPGIACVPYTAPMTMLIPDVKAIEVRDGVVSIRSEFDGAERLVHLGVTAHDGAAESLQGHSIGRWEGATLIVDTAGFAGHRNGNNWSVPSSSRKHLTERFSLSADGRRLTYAFVLEDPEYLTRPVTGDVQWAFRPDLTYVGLPCDPVNARRFAAK